MRPKASPRSRPCIGTPSTIDSRCPLEGLARYPDEVRKLILLAVPIAVIALFIGSRSSSQARSAFFGHMFAQRYDEASAMLTAPSALEVAPDGSLVLTDRAGNTTSVPAAQLPFKVSERPAEPRFPGRTMMAIGPSTGGISDFPMVTLYLSFDGGEDHIEGVDR